MASNWQNLDSDERESVVKALARTLRERWDPQGLKNRGGSGEDYSGYVFPMIARLARGATAPQVGAYLDQIRTGAMGLRADKAKDLEVAEKCVELWTLLVDTGSA